MRAVRFSKAGGWERWSRGVATEAGRLTWKMRNGLLTADVVEKNTLMTDDHTRTHTNTRSSRHGLYQIFVVGVGRRRAG